VAWTGLAVLLAGVGAAGVGSWAAAGQPAYIVGAKNFAEQYILAAVMTDRIRKEGTPATARVDLGSVIAFQALASNGIDAYIDYSGTVWSTVMKRTDSLPRQQMLQEMTTQLRKDHGVVLLGALGFENAYALAMRRDRAEQLGIRTITDLAQHAPVLRIGGDFEFFARSEWQALRDRYGLRFREQRQFQPTFLYKAVASRDVDVISAASSDGRIRADDLVVLEDPQQVIPPYDAIVLLSPARASDPVLHKALQPLVGAIPIDIMRQANYMVDRDSERVSPSQAAHWLEGELHLK
jgi:osmoprotectant transport system permease protein